MHGGVSEAEYPELNIPNILKQEEEEVIFGSSEDHS